MDSTQDIVDFITDENMKNFNFKEIAEICLSGKLSGVFVNRQGEKFHSSRLTKHYSYEYNVYLYFIEGNGSSTESGKFFAYNQDYDIVDFIADIDMKTEQKQITINIPEGKEAVQEIVDGDIHIKFVDKKLTYEDIEDKLILNTDYKVNPFSIVHGVDCDFLNAADDFFYKKVEVLRKLTNIRNYFGKSNSDEGYYIYPDNIYFKVYKSNYATSYPDVVMFKDKEHAQAAIDMLGDEIQYLFKPW